MRIQAGKVKISLGFPFFAAAAFFLSSGMYQNYLCAVIFSSLHELGHLLPMKIAGCEVREISFGAMGIGISKENAQLSYRNECISALCGPFVNLAAAVIFFFLKSRYEIFVLPFNINIGLALINMLPVRMLDGGRFINYLLLMRSDGCAVQKISEVFEVITALILIVILIITLILNVVNTSFVFFVCSLVGIIAVSLVRKRPIPV